MPKSQCGKTWLLVVSKASCCVANTFSSRLKLIRLRSSFKSTKMSKNAFFAKSSRSQWVNIITMACMIIHISCTSLDYIMRHFHNWLYCSVEGTMQTAADPMVFIRGRERGIKDFCWDGIILAMSWPNFDHLYRNSLNFLAPKKKSRRRQKCSSFLGARAFF